jgi:hypothetical protein
MRVQFLARLVAMFSGCVMAFGCDGGGQSDERRVAAPAEDVAMDPKEKQLASLPVGIEVSHDPNPAKAQIGGRSGEKYTWMFTTTVRTLGPAVTIEEFGSFAWHDGRWVFSNFTGEPFTTADFADWYSCPGGRLEPQRAYADPSNWSGNRELNAGRMKFYYIGLDDAGRRVKGEAISEQAAELLK